MYLHRRLILNASDAEIKLNNYFIALVPASRFNLKIRENLVFVLLKFEIVLNNIQKCTLHY